MLPQDFSTSRLGGGQGVSFVTSPQFSSSSVTATELPVRFPPSSSIGSSPPTFIAPAGHSSSPHAQTRQQPPFEDQRQAHFFTAPQRSPSHSHVCTVNSGVSSSGCSGAPPPFVSHTSTAPDPSILSTHSVTMAGSSAAASRIEVRDVASLVRQLAESRHEARLLQQRMQQLELTAATESLHNTTVVTNASVHSAAEGLKEKDTERDVKHASATPVEKSQSPVKKRGVVAPNGERCQDQHGGGSNSAKRHGSLRRSGRHPSSTRRLPAPHHASDSEGNRADLFSSHSASRSGSSSSSSTSSSLTSTSAFLSTSALTSPADSSSSVEATHGVAHRNASASSTDDALLSGSGSGRHWSTKRKHKQRYHKERPRSAHGGNNSSNKQSTHRKKSSEGAPGTNTSRTASARAAGKRQHRSQSDEQRRSRDASSPHRSKHHDVVNNSAAAPQTRAARDRSADRHKSKHRSRRRHRSPRHATQHERQNRTEQPLPPHEDTTALTEKRRLHQAAKELKHARAWQRRYYDLLSKYTHETARRSAELADIHDLIEYMSWEQDRARLLHPPHTPTPAITGVKTNADNRVKEQGTSNESPSQQSAAPVKRETRGTSPQRASTSSDGASTSREVDAPLRDANVAATVESGNAQEIQKFQLSPSAEQRAEQAETLLLSHASTKVRYTNEQCSNSAGEDVCQPVQNNGHNSKSASDSLQDRVAEGETPPPSKSNPFTTTPSSSLEASAAAAAYVASLRSEAEAWRQRCLNLLQQQQLPPQPSPQPQSQEPTLPSQQASYVESKSHVCASADVDITLVEEDVEKGAAAAAAAHAFASVPPPLPPRPQQRTAHASRDQQLSRVTGLVTSFSDAVTPRAWEEAENGREEAGGQQTWRREEKARKSKHSEEDAYTFSETPYSTLSSTPPTLSSLPPPPDHQTQQREYHHHLSSNENTIGGKIAKSASSYVLCSTPSALSNPLPHPPQPHRASSYAAPQHRYAPAPALPVPEQVPSTPQPPPKDATQRPGHTSSAAALHALYLATEQRHVELSPSAHSPPRPSLFAGVPGYEPSAAETYFVDHPDADRATAAAGSAESPFRAPAHRLQVYNVDSNQAGVAQRGDLSTRGHHHNTLSPRMGAREERSCDNETPADSQRVRGEYALHSAYGHRDQPAGAMGAFGYSPHPPQHEQQQQQRQQSQGSSAQPYLFTPPPPLAASRSALQRTQNPLLRSTSQQPPPQQHHNTTAAVPSYPYAPASFQTAPPSSYADAAELVVAREQLERDIRRHDQLLAAIGKLQKTASEHASR